MSAIKACRILAPALFIQLLGLPSLAQGKIEQKPATNEDLYTYTFMGGVSTCNMIGSNLADFDKSLGNSIGMVGITIATKHKSQILDAQGKVINLSQEQLQGASAVQIFEQVARLCGKSMSGTNLQQYDKMKVQIESALKKAKGASTQK